MRVIDVLNFNLKIFANTLIMKTKLNELIRFKLQYDISDMAYYIGIYYFIIKV